MIHAYDEMYVEGAMQRLGDMLEYACMDGGYDIDHRLECPEPAWREDRSDLYWSGWVLAYFQWYENLPFSEIWNSISIRMLQKMYTTLHEADISKAVDTMEGMLKKIRKNSVQNLRFVRGLTQQELADRARMSVSQLQRIEYGERKVENLSLKTRQRLLWQRLWG